MGHALGDLALVNGVAARAAGSRRARVIGVDVARALAIFGMLAVHIGPTDVESVLGRVYASPHGRASILFALVAGISVSLLAAGRSRTSGATRRRLLYRAALLLPVGLALQLLDHGANVILQTYALLFVLAALALGLSDRWLLGLAAVSASLGPLGFLRGQLVAPETFDRSSTVLGDAPAEVLHGLVLSGPYPLITWAAPFLIGMWLGRRDLLARRLRVRLVAVGAAVTVGSLLLSRLLLAGLGDPVEPAGIEQLASAGPHSQMPLWVIGATGSALLVVGLALLAAHHLRRLVWPLAAAGQLALTLYVGHLLVLHTWHDGLTTNELGHAVWVLTVFVIVAVAAATLWRARFARGPLEAAMTTPWDAVRSRRSARPAPNGAAAGWSTGPHVVVVHPRRGLPRRPDRVHERR